MRRLIYHSIAEFEDKKSETAAIQDILKSAHRINRALGITGVLMYEDSIFTQVLEGAPEAVSELTLKISRDPRHHTMVIDQCVPIETRAFEGFTMGYVPAGHHELRLRLRGYLDHGEAGWDPLHPNFAATRQSAMAMDPAAIARRRARQQARHAQRALIGA